MEQLEAAPYVGIFDLLSYVSRTITRFFECLEERMGFEPTKAFTSQHFQCCAFNLSATSPKNLYYYNTSHAVCQALF